MASGFGTSPPYPMDLDTCSDSNASSSSADNYLEDNEVCTSQSLSLLYISVFTLSEWVIGEIGIHLDAKTGHQRRTYSTFARHLFAKTWCTTATN